MSEQLASVLANAIAQATSAGGTSASSTVGPTIINTSFNNKFWGENLKVGDYLCPGRAFVKGKVEHDAITMIPGWVLNAMRQVGGADIDDIDGRLAAFAMIMAYAGFDPIHTRHLMWSRFLKKGEFNLETEDGRKSAYVEFYSEIVMIILAFLQRGANVSKIEAKSKPQALAVFRSLRSKYEIVTSGRDNRDTITLPRVAQSFPEVTAAVYIQIKDLRVVGSQAYLPRGLMFSGSASLIYGAEIFICYLAWAESQDRIINQKGSKFVERRVRVKMENGEVVERTVLYPSYAHFSIIAYESQLYSNDERLNYTCAIIEERASSGRLSLPNVDQETKEALVKNYAEKHTKDSIKAIGEDVAYCAITEDHQIPSKWVHERDGRYFVDWKRTGKFPEEQIKK